MTRLASLAVPLLLAILELTHPARVEQNPTWWLVLHVLHLPLFVVLAWVLYQLAGELDQALGVVVKIGALLFAAFYTAYDTLAGLSVGLLYEAALAQPPDAQSVIAGIAQQIALSPLDQALARLGTFGWVIAVSGVAVGVLRRGGPRLSAVLLWVGALALVRDHPPPFGPLAFGGLCLGLFWRTPARRRIVQPGIGQVGAAVVVLDQAVKIAARTNLSPCLQRPTILCDHTTLVGGIAFENVTNAGSPFGLLPGLGIWIVLAGVGLVVALTGPRLYPRGRRAVLVAAGLQIGGAASNLLDRLLVGGVTDVFNAGTGFVFNVADVALLAGVVICALVMLARAGQPSTDGLRVAPGAASR